MTPLSFIVFKLVNSISSNLQSYQWAVVKAKWTPIINGRDTTGEFSPPQQKDKEMESPHLANFDDENPEEINYALEHPEIVKNMMEMIDSWEEDLLLHTSFEE